MFGDITSTPQRQGQTWPAMVAPNSSVGIVGLCTLPTRSALGYRHLDCHGKTDASDLSDHKVTPLEIALRNNHLMLKLDLLPGPMQWEAVLMPQQFLITDGCYLWGQLISC